jgi:hypothetical protein
MSCAWPFIATFNTASIRSWDADLCLQALGNSEEQRFTHVALVPLFHNSASDWSLPAAYRESEKKLLAKYPQLQVIISLCSTFRGAKRAKSSVARRAFSSGFADGDWALRPGCL